MRDRLSSVRTRSLHAYDGEHPAGGGRARQPYVKCMCVRARANRLLVYNCVASDWTQHVAFLCFRPARIDRFLCAFASRGLRANPFAPGLSRRGRGESPWLRN